MLIIRVAGKVLLKTMTLLSLVLLTIFNSILKVAIFFFGLAAVPIATVAVIAACVMGFMNGFGSDSIIILSVAVLLVSLKFLLPLIPKSFDTMKFNMKEYLYEPLIIKSPVKYTI